MYLSIIGPSGSGKGTQAELLAQKYQLFHISTGELFRKEYAKKSPEGLAAYQFWSAGKWVPDAETFALLKIYMGMAKTGFILDGFPRTVGQAIMLDRYLKEQGLSLDCVINLEVSENEVVKRLLLRAQKDKGEKGASRNDETENVIRQRINSFKESIAPILEYYQEQKKIINVNGEGEIEDIFKSIVSKIKI